MADKKNYDAIADLEKKIAENSSNFEKWKLSNHTQRGTPEYKEGVRRFEEYDRILRAKIAVHQGINVESGPKNIDDVLVDLLDKVDVTDFARAIQTVNGNDPTFYPSLRHAFHNHQSNSVKSEVFRNMTRPQFYPGYSNSPYGYASPQVSATPAFLPTAKIITLQRPVSPVRDYQKKSGAPFQDFSV